MFNIGATELILILVIALIVFGPGKLPDVGRAIGKSIREFKKASREIQDGLEKTDPEPDDSKRA
ncbi:MAG: twin-arginine translocase TatA/TatE family subunit [Bacillota bacterium]